MNPELAGAVWRKSTKSSNNGQCVEVADLGQQVAVRDSKHADGPALVFDGDVWDTFVAGLRSGDLAQ